MPGNHRNFTNPLPGIIVAFLTLLSGFINAATITWSTVSGTWTDNSISLQWNPSDEPDADDIARFNTDVNVTLGSANEILGLILSGGANLNTNGHNLTATDSTTISAASTTLELVTGSRLFTGNLTVGTGGILQLSGGVAILEIEKTPNALFTIGAGSSLTGFGNIGLLDTPNTPTTLVNNNGTIRAFRPQPDTFPPPTFYEAPPLGTLQITPASANARIDLDGSSETGTVNIGDNQTLDLNLPLADSFNSSLTLQRNSVFDSASPWTLAGGSILASNEGLGIFGEFGGPSHIRGATFTQSGGTLTVDENSNLEIESPFTVSGGTVALVGFSSLIVKAPFTMTGGTISTAGVVTFESDVNVGVAANITLTTAGFSTGLMRFPANITAVIDAKVINDGDIISRGILNLNNPSNDYSGINGNGYISASGGILNLRANGAAPLNFDGRVHASDGGLITVGAPSDVNFLQNSTLSLQGSTLRSPAIVRISGDLNIFSGDSVIEQSANTQTLLTPTMDGAISGNLLFTAGLNIQQGAAPTGTGSFQIPSGKSLTVTTTDLVNVHIRNGGILATKARLKSYEQTSTGSFTPKLDSTTPGQFDQLVVNGTVQLSGSIRPVLGTNYVPQVGDTFDIITANTVTGSVNFIQPQGLSSTLAFSLVKTSASIRLVVILIPPYQTWARSFFTTSSVFNATLGSPGADPDRDGLTNYAEFALDGHPNSSTNNGKIIGKIATISGQPALTYTFPVRTGATVDPADPAGGEFVLRNTASQVRYRVQATSDLANFNLEVQEITGPEATTIQQSLPIPTTGWAYRTFRLPGPISANPCSFLRVEITE